ncbi:uncharacterized protein [Solanum lycopersicum]|uniref:uncharacterized protein isoform X2 n=1 Tax=Solanum lycopersicum TaxID=4081 RepID=UPI0037498031
MLRHSNENNYVLTVFGIQNEAVPIKEVRISPLSKSIGKPRVQSKLVATNCICFAIGLWRMFTHNGDNQSNETAGSGDSLNEQEYRHTIELEDDDRKVEEVLEYLKQMENDAKLKHLAEQT